MPVVLLKYWSQIALGLALAVTAILYVSARNDRASLLSTISVATNATDSKGRPGTLSVNRANQAIRDMAATIQRVRKAQQERAEKESAVVIKTERADANTNTEVSNNVLLQLAQTRADLDAARALAAERLRTIRASGNADGRVGETQLPYDPEPACNSYAGTSCDGLLARLAAAEENTVKLLGWQAWYPQMKANHDAAMVDLQAGTSP